MSLVRYKSNFDDFAPVNFSNLIDRFFTDSARLGGSSVNFIPKVDIWENEKGFDVNVTVPGMKKEDFQIDLNDNTLTVSGERKINRETKEEHYRSVETQYGKFSRSFTLPENVDASAITAKYVDGVLELFIPKDEKRAQKTTIKVN